VASALQTLWIDGVGGYGIWGIASIELGRTVDPHAGISIQGDLPGRSVRIERSGEEWMVSPIAEVSKNRVKVDSKTLIQHGDRIKLGEQVELLFEQVNPWSTTAMLRILSRHRWADPVDGILLVGQTCLLGPNPGSNIQCLDWNQSIVMFRKENAWMIRPSRGPMSTHHGSTKDALHVDAMPLKVGQRVESAHYSLTLL
jgi:hypothetical protein